MKKLTLMNLFFLLCVAGMSTSYSIDLFYVFRGISYFDLFVPFLLLLLFIQRPNTQLKVDGILLALIGLGLISGVSVLASLLSSNTYAANPFYFFRSLFFITIYFLVLYWPTSRANIVMAMFVGMLVSIFIATYVWTTAPRFLNQIPMFHVLDSPTGIKINRNQIGFCSSLAFLISAYSYLYQDLMTPKKSLLLSIFLAGFTLLTFSKGAWLLMFIGLIVLLLLRFSAIKFTLWLCALSSAYLLILYVPNTLGASIMMRLVNSGETNDYRIQYVKDAIDIGSKSPILGIGPGNYGLASSEMGYTTTIDPHNAYLQMFSEQGIFATFLVLLIYSLLLLKGLKYRKYDKLSNLIVVFAVCLFVDGFVSGLSLSSKYLYIFSAVLLAGRPKRLGYGRPPKVVGTFGNV